MMTIKPSHVAIQYADTLCADGETRSYTDVLLVGFCRDENGNKWRCERVIRSGEHWEPAVDRAAQAHAEIEGVDVLDLRD